MLSVVLNGTLGGDVVKALAMIGVGGTASFKKNLLGIYPKYHQSYEESTIKFLRKARRKRFCHYYMKSVVSLVTRKL